MFVERLDRLAICVPDLDEAMREFKDGFGIEFETGVLKTTLPSGTKIKCAISSKGIELVEKPDATKVVTSFHLRVRDLDAALNWVEKNQGSVLERFSIGKMEEAICSIFGLRVILLTYPGDDVIKAISGII